MAIEVFNRFENKYMIDSDTFFKLKQRLSDFMEADAYNKKYDTYSISNIYYDTEDSHLIRTSLAKPDYKEKLRLRSYGTPDADAKVYVEIKKKFCGLTNKRRSAMKLSDAYTFLANGEIPELKPGMNPQVLREIEYILQQHRLVPSLYLAYDRRAYFGIGEHDLRVSFDRNIRSRRYDLFLEAGDYGDMLLDDGMWLMEVKSSESIPLWFARLLSEHKIYPTSFSKYGTVYTQELERAHQIPAAAFGNQERETVAVPALATA